jgi:large subunit ribosomal protein L32
MAVPKKRRSKSKKNLKKQCWKKKAEIETQKACSIYKLVTKEKKKSEIALESTSSTPK